MEQSVIVQARGNDLSAQDGSETGCVLPEEAVAVVLQLEAVSSSFIPRLKLWAADAPEPAETVMDGNLSVSEGLDVANLKLHSRFIHSRPDPL
ncbi:MAG: hypothetical protein ACWGQW_10390 [bacterium]